jgi:hypothetical protein
MNKELTYEERVRWFVNNYYETGMEYASMLESMKNEDLDNFEWYGEKIQIPKFYKLPQPEISDEYTDLINAIRKGTGMSIKDAKKALLDVTEDVVELCRQWYRKNGKKF